MLDRSQERKAKGQYYKDLIGLKTRELDLREKNAGIDRDFKQRQFDEQRRVNDARIGAYNRSNQPGASSKGGLAIPDLPEGWQPAGDRTRTAGPRPSGLPGDNLDTSPWKGVPVPGQEVSEFSSSSTPPIGADDDGLYDGDDDEATGAVQGFAEGGMVGGRTNWMDQSRGQPSFGGGFSSLGPIGSPIAPAPPPAIAPLPNPAPPVTALPAEPGPTFTNWKEPVPVAPIPTTPAPTPPAPTPPASTPTTPDPRSVAPVDYVNGPEATTRGRGARTNGLTPAEPGVPGVGWHNPNERPVNGRGQPANLGIPTGGFTNALPMEPGPGVRTNGLTPQPGPGQFTNWKRGFASGGAVEEDPAPAGGLNLDSAPQQTAPLTPPGNPADETTGKATSNSIGFDAAEALSRWEKGDNPVDQGFHFLMSTSGAGAQGMLQGATSAMQPNSLAQRLVSNEGRATNAEVKQLDDIVDPNRELTAAARIVARFDLAFGAATAKGDVKTAQQVAAGLVLHANWQSRRLGSMAVAALEQGDVETATKFLRRAYNNIPDGKELVPEVRGGQIAAKLKDQVTGEITDLGVFGPEQLMRFATGAADGSLFMREMLAASQRGGRGSTGSTRSTGAQPKPGDWEKRAAPAGAAVKDVMGRGEVHAASGKADSKSTPNAALERFRSFDRAGADEVESFLNRATTHAMKGYDGDPKILAEFTTGMVFNRDPSALMKTFDKERNAFVYKGELIPLNPQVIAMVEAARGKIAAAERQLGEKQRTEEVERRKRTEQHEKARDAYKKAAGRFL